MQADKSITPDIVYEHGMEGFNEQKEYNLLLYMSMAMETVREIAGPYDDYKDAVCTCNKCAYYRSPKWLAERPEDMTRKELPWKSFQDVDEEVFEQIHEVYVRQHSRK
ncbi:hypothetical protein PHMEG_00017259 [Phytophthora megakarya]|uniref:Uncharacterized protein n=1 Tax=Phytophthora megakarya TaxID=4795 RepID=A0A225VYC6_9STRA|nr:hypothetical protein PHMEG_00017259 [Phytophthora megakarya]